MSTSTPLEDVGDVERISHNYNHVINPSFDVKQGRKMTSRDMAVVISIRHILT